MTIALSCPACDKALKVKDELAGKKVKCPGCGEPILVESEANVADEEPARKTRDEEDDDRPRKKKKKKKKSKALMWIALGGGIALLLLLLGVVGVLVYVNLPEKKVAATATKKEEPPKFDPPPPRPKGGIVRSMDVQEVKNNMKSIGLAYHNYLTSFNKAPAKADDLMPLLERSQVLEKMLTDGSVVFIYNVRVLEMTEGSSNTLLAYEKDADMRGFRVVLFGDGSVDMLQDAEFQAKPKARPRQ